MLSLTYRYGTHIIAEGIPQGAPLAVNATNDGTVTINETRDLQRRPAPPRIGASTAASRCSTRQRLYPMTPRKPSSTGCIPCSGKILGDDLGSYNDLEHHNNTNNDQLAVSP